MKPLARMIRILLLALTTAGTAMAAEGSFYDAEGTEIFLPAGLPVYTQAAPGPWQTVASQHDPEISSRVREEGLEDIRFLKVHYPHPMNKAEKDWIEAVYVLDKDGLIIGYQNFAEGASEARAEMRLNGVINYMEIYAHCLKHGLWRTKLQLK